MYNKPLDNTCINKQCIDYVLVYIPTIKVYIVIVYNCYVQQAARTIPVLTSSACQAIDYARVYIPTIKGKHICPYIEAIQEGKHICPYIGHTGSQVYSGYINACIVYIHRLQVYKYREDTSVT